MRDIFTKETPPLMVGGAGSQTDRAGVFMDLRVFPIVCLWAAGGGRI